MNLWWAPGQNDTTAEICQHMDGTERTRLMALVFGYGLCCFAMPAVILFSFAGLGPFDGLLANAGFTFLVLALLILAALAILRVQRRLMLDTRYARDHGVTLEDLTANRPLSRKDYLNLAMVFGVAVAIAVIAFLVAGMIAA